MVGRHGGGTPSKSRGMGVCTPPPSPCAKEKFTMTAEPEFFEDMPEMTTPFQHQIFFRSRGGGERGPLRTLPPSFSKWKGW